MVKMSHHTKNEISMSRHSKVKAQTDRRTDTHRHYKNITFSHTQAVIIFTMFYFLTVYRIQNIPNCQFKHLKYLNIRHNKIGPDDANAKAFEELPENMYLETDRWV